MWVYCKDVEVFNTQITEEREQLRNFLEQVGTQKHILLIPDSDALLQSRALEILAPERRQEIQEQLERISFAANKLDWAEDPVSRPGRPHAELARTPLPLDAHRRWSLTPANAGEWAENALYLLLENATEHAFLLWVVRLYRKNKLEFALQKRWLISHGCGGCGEVKTVLEKLTCAGRDLSLPGASYFVGAPDPRPLLRYMVWVDSDIKAVGEEPERTIQDINRLCRELRIPCWVRRKREIENYLPELILRAVVRLRTQWTDTSAKLEEWQAIDKTQRDFFDTKTLFGKHNKQSLLEQAALLMQKEEYRTDSARNALEMHVGDELERFLTDLEEYL